MGPDLTRRGALLGLTAAWSLGGASLALAAGPTDRRLVVVNLRGALDGMAAVVPYGDPHLAGLRGGLVPPGPGHPGGLLDLGGFFGLHPALAGLHGFYRAGELLPVHAVGGPTRSRSHFEAQDCLESGAGHRLTSGWLNRAVASLDRPTGRADLALSVGVSLPLLLRGPAPVGDYAPHVFPRPDPDFYARVAALNAADPITGPAIRDALAERQAERTELAGLPAGSRPARFGFPALAQAAGALLAAAAGPRVAALEVGGWDTHAQQTVRLRAPLHQLDAGLRALRQGLGPAWARTVVLVMTEFGRTARQNGTGGTDHGTATVAFLAGGAVAGGRVAADWPGLGPGKLLQNRDLMPTADLRAIAAGVLVRHLGVAEAALPMVFPDSRATPATGLLRV